MKGTSLVDEMMGNIHRAESEVWETKREVEVLKDRIRMLEEFFCIELVETKEHYQEKRK